jgi:hypothetical protein
MLLHQAQQNQNVPQGQIGGWNAWPQNMIPEENQDEQNVAPLDASDGDQTPAVPIQQEQQHQQEAHAENLQLLNPGQPMLSLIGLNHFNQCSWVIFSQWPFLR